MDTVDFNLHNRNITFCVHRMEFYSVRHFLDNFKLNAVVINYENAIIFFDVSD